MSSSVSYVLLRRGSHVHGDMDELDKVTDEPHHSETYRDRSTQLDIL